MEDPKIVEACRKLADRIQMLPLLGRAAIAIIVAQRLMDVYLERSHQKNPFVAGWAPTLALLSRSLTDSTHDEIGILRSRLREYYASPYCHTLGPRALLGADEHAAAASIYALEAYCGGTAGAASAAALRLIEWADQCADLRTEMLGGDLMSEAAAATRNAASMVELNRLERALNVIKRYGVTQESVAALNCVFSVDELGEWVDHEDTAANPRTNNPRRTTGYAKGDCRTGIQKQND
jgi:hypothetical protein